VEVTFPVSGVVTDLWLPPLVALAVSYVASMGGISGAVLLLPYQMSVLGFVSPAVSPTNLVFNIVAIPSGVWRYVREGRMVWPLAWIIAAGSLPGVVLGGIVRLGLLHALRPFQGFVGCVLLVVGGRLLLDVATGRRAKSANEPVPSQGTGTGQRVVVRELSWQRLSYEYSGETHSCAPVWVVAMSLAVGIIGGIYGVGGGAIIAPLLITTWRLPVHTVAGPTLFGTLLTSAAGVAFYEIAARFLPAMAVAPDLLLGSLLGLGGAVGMYLGARTQRLVPALWLKLVLGAVVVWLAVRYLGSFVGWPRA